MVRITVPLIGFAFAVVACSQQPPVTATTPARPAITASSAAPTPSTLATSARPVLRVGASGDYAPFSMRDTTGRVSGFDAQIAESLATDLGLDIEWVSFRWPTLQTQIEQHEFDVAMSGVTWQPQRALLGFMTRALARGGPCVIGNEQAARIGVNRGGILEAWARTHFAKSELELVADNQSLPDLLGSRGVEAIVTDSFERKSFARAGSKVRCEPALWRKVYWIAPQAAAAGSPPSPQNLAADIERWLRDHPQRIQAAQARWFGETQTLDALTNLSDLLARRLAYMPLVAGAKAKRGLPIEDLPREKVVLDAAAASALKLGLPEPAARAFFALQIELSKAVQRRQSETNALDLSQQIRPVLNELGDRILDAVVEARAAGSLARCSAADFELLSPWLKPDELEQIAGSLRSFADGAQTSKP